jgi:hypothetical protein
VRTVPGNDEPGEVVGTYRVLTPSAARRAGSFYSDTEFDLTRLRPLRERMVELGRSCVHPDHRSGAVILALWGALAQFMEHNAMETVIGCASISMRDGGHCAASLWASLRETHLAPVEWQVRPRVALPVDDLNQSLDVEPPALIKGYLRMGAKVLGAAGLGSGVQHGRPADADPRGRHPGPLPAPLPGLNAAAPRARRLLAFAELVVDERSDGVGRLLLVLAFGLEFDFGAEAGGQHHDAHDALGVDAAAVAGHEHLALEAAGQFRELGRRAGVKAQLIADDERCSNHS